jgi:hypothetical protein
MSDEFYSINTAEDTPPRGNKVQARFVWYHGGRCRVRTARLRVQAPPFRVQADKCYPFCFRNGDECYQLELPEMLAKIIMIIISGVHHNNHSYDSWRAR